MKGFTLIELLIIFAISSMIVGISINSFSSFNNSQVLNGTVSEVKNILGTAKSRAISQVKPAGCGSVPLDGYEIKITLPSDYEQNAVCGSTRISIQKKKLPSQVSFVTGSAGSVLFDVGTGIVAVPGQIAISGFGKTTTLSVSKTGTVVSTDGLSITPVPTPTPTSSVPTPTPTPTPTTGPSTTPIPCSTDERAYSLLPRGGCTYVGEGAGFYCDETCTY